MYLYYYRIEVLRRHLYIIHIVSLVALRNRYVNKGIICLVFSSLSLTGLQRLIQIHFGLPFHPGGRKVEGEGTPRGRTTRDLFLLLPNNLNACKTKWQ